MSYIRLLPLLLLLVYPAYVRSDEHNGGNFKDEDLKTMLNVLVNFFSSVQNSNSMMNNLSMEVKILTEAFNTCKACQISDKENQELKSMVQEQTNQIKALTEKIESQGGSIQYLEENIKELRMGLDERLKENELKVEWALTDGTLAPKNTSGIMDSLARQETKIEESLDVMRNVYGTNLMAGNCGEINFGVGAQGVLPIYPNHSINHQVLVSCEMSAGGGWTVIQRRFDGSVDFFRGWEDYVEGFGDPAGEFWLGLRHIHTITQTQPMELYVGVTDFDRGDFYAMYSSFYIASAEEKYRLHIGAYFGNAGDSLRRQNGQRFSTKDQDNDSHRGDCSNKYHGAWWYKDCHHSNLNGHFAKIKTTSWQYMSWYHLRTNGVSMKASIMMMRPAKFKP